jgi:D-alanyl-D-alanine carboxypeptidase/D-alanyl-D-alanine-endopeptidase (penicillin-binding protein 4)
MKPRLFNRSPVTLLVFCFLILAIAATTRAIRQHETTRAEDKPARKAAPLAESKPANSPADAQLARLIDQAIDQSEFSSARWGLIVISRSDGRTLYARNSDRLFTPASNMKIYTTAVALDLLGANYQWRTSVYGASQPDPNGVLNGDLTLYGRGAPDLLSRPRKDETASLVQLANELYQHGVRHISGNVIGDESYFRADPLGDGWEWNDVQWYFGAEPSALTIDDNEVDIQIAPSNSPNDPPVVKLSNAQDYVHLANNMATVKRGEQMTIGIHRGVSDNEVRVWGECPLGSRGFSARLSIHDPALRATRLFMDVLKARGITVDGAAHTRDFRAPANERLDPSRAVELAYVSSKPLGEIVRATNKESINLNAELILRTLGRERGEIAPDTDPHKTHERSDDEAGLAVIRLWLNRANIPANNLALHDGSGLSRLDLVTPEATARLLVAISKTASASVFQESLPIAGRDGTLNGRLRTFKDRVSAKTGSLTYDNSLSGFLAAADGEPLVFSILCNDQTSRASSIRLIDEIVTILAKYPRAKAENP